MKSKNINFLPSQYIIDKKYKINHNYLLDQFRDYKKIFKKIEKIVLSNDYTLGKSVDNFEKEFAAAHKALYAIGVGSGTDAIFLSLKALDIGAGDEVITTPFTFHATIGAIVASGARPVFVDIDFDGFNINVSKIEAAITSRTKAIVPVHWAGRMCDMQKMRSVARKFNLRIVEDACHAVFGTRNKHFAGTFSDTACFSFHPLKNLNGWGDGGIILTNSKALANRLKLLRNHGLVSRDVCREFGYNSRLDTIQAVIVGHLFKKLPMITKTRIKNSHYLDSKLRYINQITLPSRQTQIKEVFHIYSFLCQDRDKLQKYLQHYGIDAKIHYPIPLHLQKAAKSLNYKKNDFPVAESVCRRILSLPVHEFISKSDLDFMIKKIFDFYHE